MNILIITDCYLPTAKCTAQMVHDLAVEFRKQNHVPIVLVPDAGLASQSTISIEQGITVLRVKTGPIKGARHYVRAINEYRLSSRMWKAGKDFFRKTRCDLIVFNSPSIFFGPLVGRLKSLWGCRTYLVLRDIFPQWAVDTGVLRKGLAYRFFRMAENRQYAVADVIGVQSPANLRYFTARGFENKHNLEVLYNWTALTKTDDISRNYRKELGLQDKIVFFYGGNIGVAQDIDCIIRLAERLRDNRNAYFLLVGDGSETARLKKTISQRKLTNISLHPTLSQQEYLAMLAEFDVGMIALHGNHKTHNFPGKMLGYMRLAKPILASVNPDNDLMHIIDNAQAGLTAMAGDDRKLYRHAIRLTEDETFRRRLGHNARKLTETTFSSAKAASQISKICNNHKVSVS